MTGSGRVVAEKDAAEVARRAEALMAEFDPKSTVGQAMVGQIAILSVRLELCAEQVEAATRSNVRHAVEAFDHGREDEAEAALDAIADDPRKVVRRLKRSPEGIDRLVEAWGELRHALTRAKGPAWGEAEQATATSLLGCRPGQSAAARLERLSDEARAERAKGGPAAAFGRLIELVEEQVAALETHRESLDLEAIELDRLEAPGRVLFDDSRKACLARRYEAEASRRFYRALKELRLAEAEFEAAGLAASPATPEPRPSAAPPPPPAPIPAPATTPAARPLGSFRAGVAPAAGEPVISVLDDMFGPVSRADGHARGLDGRVLAVGRALVTAD